MPLSFGLIAALWFTTASAAPGSARAGDDDASRSAARVRTVEGVHEYRLDNGLRLLVVSDPSRSTFTLVHTFFAGLADDPPEANGMAHLIEHVALFQTANHPRLADEVAARGDICDARFDLEWTRFCFLLPYTAENLAWALGVSADRILHPLYTPEAVARERAAIRQEEDLHRNDPRESMIRLALGLANNSHPYHQAGMRQNLDSITPEWMMKHHRTYYRADNAVLVLAGPIETAEAIAAVTSAFAGVKKSEVQSSPPVEPQPVQEGERSFVLERPGEANAAMFLFRTPNAFHADYAPLAVLTELLRGGAGYDGLKTTKRLAQHETRVVTDFDVAAESGFLTVYGQAKNSWSANALKTGLERALADFVPGITSEKVEAAKQALARKRRRTFYDSDEFAFQLAFWQATGDWRLFFSTRDKINSANAGDVLRVARDYLKRTNRTTGVLVATAKPDLTTISSGDAETLRDYRGGPPPDEGERFSWALPELEARTRRGVLKGGFKYALTPVKMRGGRAVLSLTLHTESLDPVAPSHASLWAKMLVRGTRTLDRRAFEARLQALEAEVEVTPVPGGLMMLVDVHGGHVEGVLDLIAEAFREPRFDPHELERLKAEELSALGATNADAEETARQACLAELYPRGSDGRPYVPSLAQAMEETRRTTSQHLAAAHRVILGRAAGEWVVVGSHDALEVERRLNLRFGDWKLRSTPSVPEGPHAFSALRVRLPGAAVAALCTAARLPPFIGDDVYPAVQVATILMATAGAAVTRVGRRLRFQDRFSYSVWGFLDDLPRFPEPTVQLTVTYDPAKEAEVTRALRDELELVGDRGFSPEEVETGKKLWLGRRRTRLSDPKRLAPLMAAHLQRGKTFRDEEALAKEVLALKSEDLAAAVATYFAPSSMPIVFAGPQNKE